MAYPLIFVKKNSMEIKISKKEIFGEVEKRTSLEGLVASDNYDNIWADGGRGELLESYWIVGYTAIIQLLKRYITNSTLNYTLTSYDDDEVVTINATMPARYSSLLDGSVATDVKMMVACNIISKWLKVVSPEVSVKYDEEAKEYAEDLRIKLSHRTDPNVTSVKAKSDEESALVEEVDLADAKSDEERIESEFTEFCAWNGDTESLVQGWNLDCSCNHCNLEYCDRTICIKR